MNLRTIAICLLLAATELPPALAQDTSPKSMPPEAQEAMRKGVIAAKSQDYLLAIRYFEAARKVAPYAPAPEIFFNLGLAESKLPGRELRSIAWFGCYLAVSPNAPYTAAIKEQIGQLEAKSRSNIEHLLAGLKQMASKVPTDDRLSDPVAIALGATKLTGVAAEEALHDVAILYARLERGEGQSEDSNDTGTRATDVVEVWTSWLESTDYDSDHGHGGLNTPPFIDFSGYLKSLSEGGQPLDRGPAHYWGRSNNDPEKIFYNVYCVAKIVIDRQLWTEKRIKEQLKR